MIRTGVFMWARGAVCVAALVAATFAAPVSQAWATDALSPEPYLHEASDTTDPAPAPPVQDPRENVARGKTAVADSTEASALGAEKAVDGDTTGQKSRWASAIDATPTQDGGPHWVYVDLGQERDVKTVRVYWELRKAKGYKIQLATGDTAPAADGDGWQTVYTNTDRPADRADFINLDKAYKARFVRLYIDHNTYDDPDGGPAWGNVSIHELEVYGGAPAMSMDELADAITVTPPNPGDQQLNVNLPVSDEYDITYNGTDYEQVIGAQADDGAIPIYQPLVDIEVKVSFKVTKKSDKNTYAFKEISVTVPGKYHRAEGDNAAPEVLPELREWKGITGAFTPSASTHIVYADDDFKAVAEELAEDYKDLFGAELAVVKGGADSANAGDISLTRSDDESLGLQDEGYLMEIGDKVSVTATTKTGAYWSTRTILQALKTGNGSMPQGIARDYPLYKVRGLILDVGRKTFSLDWLKQMTKQLSWFKLNDFHVHLNDNYIWVEEYTDATVDQAYSGFRLESDIKKGGNGGKNQADLTSTDVWYSKADFRAFIQESRERGVNIVPEFDMPAHSLAFTKVRPDLRTPTSMTRRGNDHLNLAQKYDESLAFATSVWDEYTKGDNPVFDTPVLHIGADEYEADGTAYRKFVKDMFEYVESTGRTGRVWGSLTKITGDGSVQVSGVNEKTGKRRQSNLWSVDWASMKEMYDLGFELINSNDGPYYIVPNATYYGDYLNGSTVYNHAINGFGSAAIPAGDPQMAGGAFAVWNDMCGKRENGMSEYDVYGRITSAAGLYSAASWGKGGKDLAAAKAVAEKLGDAPNTNFGYETKANDGGTVLQLTMDSMGDASGNGNDLRAPEATAEAANIEDVDFKKALALTGGSSYVELSSGLETAGLGNDLRVKVKRTSASTDEQILFESPYGSIKTVQAGTGKVGISRENHDYSFNYALPVNEWVELEFKNEHNIVKLYVNGELKDALGNNTRGRLKATVMFPVQRIGSTEHAFKGYVDDVRLTRNAEFASTMPLDNALLKAEAVLASGAQDTQLEELVARAKALISQVNPSADEIAALVSNINERIAQAEFERADYARLDALLAVIPTDRSMYTDESATVLQSAIDSIQRDLPRSMQPAVDAYVQNVVWAIEGLELKAIDDNFAEGLTATACSEELTGEAAPNGPVAAVVDGNEASFWHSRWSGTADYDMPHWLNLRLAGPAKVDAMVYVPRSDGARNGRLTKYRVEVSTDDGATYVATASGTLESSTGAKTIAFGRTIANVTDVKLYFDETDGVNEASKNKFASAAEVRVHCVNDAVDLDGLNVLAKQAEGLDKDAYTVETWNALGAAIEDAKKFAESESPSFEDVNAAKQALRNVLLSLRPAEGSKAPDPEPAPEPAPLPQPAPADKADLQAKADEAAKLAEKDYTAESWKAFTDALTAVRAVLADDNATQADVDTALAALSAAADGLKVPAPMPDHDSESAPTPDPEPAPEPNPEPAPNPNPSSKPAPDSNHESAPGLGQPSNKKPSESGKGEKPGASAEQKPGVSVKQKTDDTGDGSKKSDKLSSDKGTDSQIGNRLPNTGDIAVASALIAGGSGLACLAGAYLTGRRRRR